ncbi:hypothetical protein FAES_4072 [Fibrella aestuarina BUZ 2]|uniref:Uncharacterized protein n=1 Tax=Fibrella aestuarina BUZ 2 TaxID=1166018 RepID=I0KD69_9BACT|nr:hypothetical protein FAES_4072 [Fibrella aestuarina BUZ 2]
MLRFMEPNIKTQHTPLLENGLFGTLWGVWNGPRRAKQPSSTN